MLNRRRSQGGRRFGRALTAVAALALTVGGLAVTAGTAGASSVSGTGMCFGYAGAGGCQPAFGGSSTGTAGATELIGVAMTVATTLTPGEYVTVDASSLAPGMTFSSNSGRGFDNITTNYGCSITGPLVLSNSDQTVGVPVPGTPGCVPSAGTAIMLFLDAVNPTTPGTYSLDVSTSQDQTPVATNTFTIVAPPGAPTAPTISSGNGTVTLGWTDPVSDGGSTITGYDAYCSPTSPPSTTGTPSATVTGATATSVDVTGLANGTPQSCVVTAVNTVGQSTASSPAVSATPSTVPGAPTAPTISSGNGTVTLGWTDPASDGGSTITGYDAYCSPTSPPSTTGTPSATVSGATATSVDVTGLANGTPQYCVVTAVNADGQSAASPPVVSGAPVDPSPGCSSTATGSASSPGGYWLAGADGAVYSCGNARFFGSLTGAGVTPAKPAVGIAATPDHGGYWLVASDGGIFAFGDAHFYGSMGGQHLNQPIVGIAATPGGGYYEVAADGGLFAFGPGAAFHGSMGGLPLNRPVVGMAVTGGGYYEVASDGGVFAFGVPFHGSTGCLHLVQPIVAIAVSPDTSSVGTGAACGVASPQAPGGYQFVAGDGGVFSFGNAGFAGSLGGQGVGDVVGLATS